MKVRVERDVLAEAAGWAARALPSRPVVPILAGLLLDASEEGPGLTLSCFDYEVSAQVSASADVPEPGRALVPGRLLADIARSLPDHPVELAGDAAAGALGLTCGSAEFTLVTLPDGDYPSLPPQPRRAGTVNADEFSAAVAQVAPAAGRDDTLPMLTGVFIEIDGESVTLAATDRYRLAVRELRWRPARPGVRASALVPARTLAEVAKTMTRRTEITIALGAGQAGAGDAGDTAADEGDADEAGASETSGAGAGAGGGRPGDGMIAFEGGGRRVTSRLLGEEFVPYRSRFPAEPAARATVQPGPFAEAVRRVSLVADRQSRLVLNFAPGHVRIEAGSGDGARAVEEAGATFDGGRSLTIGFNPQYLLDGIHAAAAAGPVSSPAAAGPVSSPAVARPSASPGSDEVTFAFTTPDKPAVISGSSGIRYLIAPMRG